MRVLVVDDSMIMRKMIVDALCSLTDDAPVDLNVVETGSGEEALKVLGQALAVDAVAEHALPDLVLLDWYLPGITGLEVMQRMQADPALADIPVVMVTSEREKSKVIEALRAGARNYIVKPFGHEVFRKKVAPLIVGGGGTGEGEAGEGGTQPGGTGAGEAAPVGGRPAGGLAGNLAHTSAIEVVQLMSLTKKTGVLEFVVGGAPVVTGAETPGRDGERYSLYFRNGQLEHAEGEGPFPALRGEEAFLASTGLAEGAFTFRTEAGEHEVTIRRPTDMLLLEAFSQATAEPEAG